MFSQSIFETAATLIAGISCIFRSPYVHHRKVPEAECSVSRRSSRPISKPVSFVVPVDLLPELHGVSIGLLNCLPVCWLPRLDQFSLIHAFFYAE